MNKSLRLVFCFAAFSLVLLSCRTLGTAPTGLVLKAASPEDFQPQWTAFAEALAPGLGYLAGRTVNPRLEFWALRVDLSEPELLIVVNGLPQERDSLDKPDVPGHMPSTWISGFVKQYGCIAGINTNPFSPVSGKEGEDRRIDGITIAEGVIVARPDPAFDALVFYYDVPDDDRPSGGLGGRAAIVRQADLDEGELGRIRNAVGGFHIVLRQGELPERLTQRGTKDPPRHPRSAAGLSGDGNILYLLAVDGRRLGSVGATEAELGILLKQFGAVWGLNFDGGGSTALVLRDSKGSVKAVNTPIHRQIPGRERGVATCLGIARAALPPAAPGKKK